MLRFRHLLVALLFVSLCLVVWPAASPAQAQTPASPAPAGTQNGPLTADNGRVHIQPRPDRVRALTGGATAATTSNNLVYHSGGPIMNTSTSYAIFWLPAGIHYDASATATADSTYESLVKSFLQDVGNTPFYNINTQYGSPAGPSMALLNSSTLAGSYVDTTAYPHAGTTTDPLFNLDIRDAVNRAIGANGWAPTVNTAFFVFTGYNIQSCLDTTRTNCTFSTYCAYHTYFNSNAGTAIYLNIPDLPSACYAGESPNNDPAADAAINLASHEQAEAITDPLLNAWYDSNGEENGDKCAWNFGPALGGGTGYQYNEMLNNRGRFYLQEEWSNATGSCVQTYGSSGGGGGTPPAAPSIGTASAAGSTSATVTWKPPSSSGSGSITGYTAAAWKGGASTGITAAAAASATSVVVSGLTSGQTYTFTVHATNSAGAGTESAPSNTVTLSSGPSAPSAPANVTAVMTGGNSATVSWAAPSSTGGATITSYTVTVTPSVGGSPVNVSGTATATTISGLSPSTTYTVTVTATNSAGLTGAGASTQIAGFARGRNHGAQPQSSDPSPG